MRVVVVGGGVIGLCCAYALRRAGAEVALVERDRFGQAASLGNAGWVTPSLSSPLPAPGVPAQALRWMLKPDSPLLIRLRAQPSFVRWCWRFWRSCSPASHRSGLEATLALNARTLGLFDELRAAGVEFEMHSTGLLFACLSEHGLEEYRAMFEDLQSAGYEDEVEVLDRDAIHELEPALADAVVGGLYARTERFVRPESLVKGLVEHLRQEGVELIEQREVLRLVPNSDGAGQWRVETSDGELAAGDVVVAGGVWSAGLLAGLGVRIPLEAAKGYSVTSVGSGTRPLHALYLTEAKVGCSPFKDAVRLAGTLELAGIDLSLNQRRIAAIVRAASVYLRDWRPEDLRASSGRAFAR